MPAEPAAVANAFVRAINSRNADAIAALMTEDHIFGDSDGTEIHGRDRMHSAWSQYCRMFPDYSITVQETYSRGQIVVLVGSAEGTYAVNGELLAENHWRVPAVWRITVRGDAVAEWRNYVNTQPIAQIIAKYAK